MTEVIDVLIGDVNVGQLTLLKGDRSFFSFDNNYLKTSNRPVLSQSFYARTGELFPQTKIVQSKLPTFFSNLLPEGHLREYLAARGNIKPNREFKLIQLLGKDLPGAVILKAHDAIAEPEIESIKTSLESNLPYRFSLAGVQLKFSALAKSSGGLTIPAHGVGGDWIVKLPAQNFTAVPENEFSMLQLAKDIGINVPPISLINLTDIAGLPDTGALNGNTALAIKRFDRGDNAQRIHIEDFAQVFGVFPKNKYDKANYATIANMVWTLTGETGITDFVKRLVFNILIGNGDMHLKNWSFIYSDGVTPQLAPAYDFVSTIPYIPNDTLALNLSGTKDISNITTQHFKALAKKAQLPYYLISSTVNETVQVVHDTWINNKADYPLPKDILKRINKHIMACKLLT